jgi:sporulation protein YlmC with PRC-barrel domain
MQESRKAILLAILAMSMAGGAYAASGDTATDTSGNRSMATARQSGTTQNAADERAWEREHRASKIIGTDVYDMQGRKIGDVKDVVVDPQRGSIDYAVLSFGGMMGVGTKYFAVPWKSLQANSDGKRYMLNVDKTALKNAPGFDKNNWPDMANQQWASDVERFWQSRSGSTGSSENTTRSSNRSSGQ